MIKVDKNEFLRPQIYSTLDEYETRCNVTKEIIEEIEKLQQENKQLQKDIKNIIKILDKNCDDLEATEEEFDSLDRWQGLQVVELEKGSDE